MFNAMLLYDITCVKFSKIFKNNVVIMRTTPELCKSKSFLP